MTDARFPERWLNDRRIIRLTDSAFRTLVLGMTWAVANRTDGYVASDDLDLVHGAKGSDAAELVKANLWSRADDAGYWIEDFTNVQTSKAQLDGLDQVRAGSARRSQKYRDKKKGVEPDPSPVSSRDDVTSPSRDSSRDDKGQDRPGQAGQERRFEQEEVVTRDVTRDRPSPEPCFTCGVRPAVNGSDCLECSSSASPVLTETRVSPGADGTADRIAPSRPAIAPNGGATVAHRAPTVRTSCAYSGCTESSRPGKQMCPMHFTHEPSSSAA